MSGPQSNTAQPKCEHQSWIETFQHDTEDRFPQRLAEGSKLPAGELTRAEVIHGQDGQSPHTTNRSEAGGSTRASSVAPSTSVGSSEAPESYSPYVDSILTRRFPDVLVHGPPSNRSDRTGSCAAPPLTSSQSSYISGLSVSDGRGERVLDQSMRLLREDGTVGNTHLQQGPILECQFYRITRCPKKFSLSEFEAWVTHTRKHFVKVGRQGAPKKYISPPTLNSCCFCEKKFQAINGMSSWGHMMSHLKEHHELGHRLAHARIDFPLVEYLWQNEVLTQAQYRDLKPSKDIPSPPPLSDDEEPVAVVEERRHRGERPSVRGVC